MDVLTTEDKTMKANKVGQDFNNSGIKYNSCTTDLTVYPRWIPWAFWSGVIAGTAIFGALLWCIG